VLSISIRRAGPDGDGWGGLPPSPVQAAAASTHG
jgi:hypothetical protein